jgi:hypothetical protein
MWWKIAAGVVGAAGFGYLIWRNVRPPTINELTEQRDRYALGRRLEYLDQREAAIQAAARGGDLNLLCRTIGVSC